MANSSAEISAAEIANRDADKPMMLSQSIPVTPTVAIWTQTGNTTDSDASATGFPASRAYDGFCHLPTKPSSAQTTWYYAMQFPSPGIEFDWIGILGENSTFNGMALQIHVADNATFSSGLKTINTLGFMPSGDTRKTGDSLRHSGAPGTDANRYSGVEYMRFYWTGSSSQPELGELIVGRRRQLKHKPRTPYDPTGRLEAEVSDAVTAAGVRSRFTYAYGRRHLEASINPAEEPYLADIPAWFRASDYGTRPFVWVEDPGTVPQSWIWLQLDDPTLSFPVQDFVERTLDIAATEQGPERFYLERE